MHISEIVRFHVPGASVLQRYLDRSFNYSLWLHCANCLPTSGPLLEKQRVNTPYMEHVSWCLLMVCWCLLMFVDVCWCLLHQIVYIYIYKLRGTLGWHWSSLPAGRPWATWSFGILSHPILLSCPQWTGQPLCLYVSRGRFPLCLLVNPRFNPCFSGQHATFFMAQLIRCCDENIHLTHLCWANIGLSLQDNKKKVEVVLPIDGGIQPPTMVSPN